MCKSITKQVIPVLLVSMTLYGGHSRIFGQAGGTKTEVDPSPLSPEQREVYKAILANWSRDSHRTINLSAEIAPIEDDRVSILECGKGFGVSIPHTNVAQRFRKEDTVKLGPGDIHLVDPNSQAFEIQSHDPSLAIQQGRPVDESVEAAFASGLFTLGEIAFDRKHTHAVLSFSFRCGTLCGSYSTVLMAKKNGSWAVQKRCGGGVS